VLSTLPKEELHRISDRLIEEHYREKNETVRGEA
jgi:vacuolar-type H+-ATPase subunit B/Vma2